MENQTKKTLLGMTLDELRQTVKNLGMPAFTGGQVADWLYKHHVSSIEEMTNISKANRTRMAETFEVGLLPPTDCQRSADGTIKYLFPTHD